MSQFIRDKAVTLLIQKGFSIALAGAAADIVLELYAAAKPQEVTMQFISNGDITLDTFMKEIKVKGEIVYLTPKEFKLFELCMRNAGRVLTNKEILKNVWGVAYGDGAQVQYVRVCIASIRSKLGAKVLKSVAREGYVMERIA